MRLFEVKLKYILRLILLFALFGFFSCVILSVIYNFEAATRTHCNVSWNFNFINEEKYLWGEGRAFGIL